MNTHLYCEFIKTRNVKTPSYGTPGSNGVDFYIPDDSLWENFTLAPGTVLLIPSGIKVCLPEHWALVMLEKSGIGMQGLLITSPLIDSDYRGEITLAIVNVSNKHVTVKRGQKIVQLAPMYIPKLILKQLNENTFSEETIRGQAGFGSTGIS